MLSVIADTFHIPFFRAQYRSKRPHSPDRSEELRKLRSELRDLDRHQLRDIGLDPDHAGAEEGRPTWRWSSR